jgi:ribosomal protein S18 acetylase RimI-like enzyme
METGTRGTNTMSEVSSMLKTRALRHNSDRDLAQLANLDSCLGQAAWPMSKFREILSQPHHHGYCVASGDTMVAYWITVKHHTEVQLLSLVVCERVRGRGIGTAIVMQVGSEMGNGVKRITAAVPETNVPALLFLKSCGRKWEESGTMKSVSKLIKATPWDIVQYTFTKQESEL